MIKKIKQLIAGIKTLAIPRIEDLPYFDSPPVQFVYEETANIVLGNYIWTAGASALTPARPILDNALYYFRDITLSADISELDFEANIVTNPQFQMFRISDANAPLFREAITMVKFYERLPYRLVWVPGRASDVLNADFTGQLVQGPALVGKTSITLKAIVTAQEIVDDNFIKAVRDYKYPNITDSSIVDSVEASSDG